MCKTKLTIVEEGQIAPSPASVRCVTLHIFMVVL
jgi:hypothetical protein